MTSRRLALSVLPAVLAAAFVAAPVLPIALAPTPAAAQGARDASAEAFVSQEAQIALRVLHDDALSAAQKKIRFRAFVDRAADVPRITRFVLGKYARTITPQQLAAFSPAFREYANTVYETRLSQYRGEGFRVTGSQMRAANDVVVNSEVVGGANNRKAPVAWRLLKAADGRWRVVDVNIAGVWLAITQQQDFVSTLDNNRGDINVLINQLEGRADNAPARR